MRCICYCTANGYDISSLYQSLQKQKKIKLYRDVLYVQTEGLDQGIGEIFYFSSGNVVFWGLSKERELNLLHELKEFEKEPLPKVRSEFDEFEYDYGDTMQIVEDLITLHNRSYLTKLAISFGIAQSVKITIFEDRIQKSIEHTKKLPEQLAQTGKILLSRKKIAQELGRIFIERSSVNLHSDTISIPEFFWYHPELDPFYRKAVQYLEVEKRMETLNRQLSVLHDMFEMLQNQQNHQHSARLEWTIIVLIAIELLTVIFKQHG